MEDHTEGFEKVYTTKEVGEMIGVATVTVRKYISEMEHNGYEVLKSKSGARMFTQKDVMALKYFKDLRDKSGIRVEQAANVVIEKFGRGSTQDVMPPDTKEQTPYDKQHADDIARLEAKIDELNQKVDEQNKYVEKSIKTRDERLMQTLNEIRETKKLQAAEKSKKKGFFARLFGKQ